ncbi:unnamed protein product [Blepharisma stoltei]|uniref:Bidirectional sugar transporter SWEET n=1 Tax=Blepharisma stoltei TaxID=1481888 RepID=A0AAU9K2U2_9CILI|nr:unnamed protein product [Blepharisma stoltei]
MSETQAAIFSALGIGLAVTLNLTPIKSLLKAKKTKDLKEISHLYLLVVAFNYASWFSYSIKMNQTGSWVNALVCLILDLIWVLFYHIIKGDWKSFVPIFLILLGSIEVALFMLFPAYVIGFAAIALLISLFAAPIEQLGYVFRLKDHNYIDVSITSTLIITAVVWIMYGFAVGDWIIVGPNIAGMAFSIFQEIVYFWARGVIPCPIFACLHSKMGKKPLIISEEKSEEIQKDLV